MAGDGDELHGRNWLAELLSYRIEIQSMHLPRLPAKQGRIRRVLLGGWERTLKPFLAMLNRVGYTPEINHCVLMEMAEHKKDLERKTKPIADTLRSYQDLPPDKVLAALAIEDKTRQYAAAVST